MNLERARTLAGDLIKSLVGTDWRFCFDANRRRFGACYHAEKTIKLSGPLVRCNDETRVLDTILHEVAHALTPVPATGNMWDSPVGTFPDSKDMAARIEYESTNGHTGAWRKKCLELGGDGQACYTSKNTVNAPTVSYVGTCPECHDQIKHKRAVKGLRCKGGGVFVWGRL